MNTNKLLSVTKPYHGVVVPMVTPVTPQGDLDEPAVRRVIDHLIEGGSGITVEHVGGRAVTYAGIGNNCLADSVHAAEEYFQLGIDVVVAHLPSYYALSPEEQSDYYAALVERIPGPLMLYNIPSTTHMSTPIGVVEKLSRHPKVIGLKDSENNVARVEAVMETLGGRSDFAIFVGVSALSARALSLGADGIVPSPAHLVPYLCQRLYESGSQGDVTSAEEYQRQVDQVADIYVRNRTLGQSLAALKAAMGALSLCGPDVLPPLRPLDAAQQEAIRRKFLEWQAKQDAAGTTVPKKEERSS